MGKETIKASITGIIKPLSEVRDDAFSHGALGKGVAIDPKEGKVVAPFDRTVMTLFPTKHAIGLVYDNGMEILIHIGLDTIQLEGKYFEAHIKQGDKVKQGQTLVTFDIKAIKKEGYILETPIIVTNSSDYLDFIETDKKSVKQNDELLTVLN
ncbi:glucose PTS transporter subunit IIA [Clostridium sp.]|uniref:PTS sugar transporter subunit IIA n=1 Tax=Clostridium sp. TaxID=1506 RepID=UPI002912C0BA|nr:glucose PTS transporter subunit IIA [Clostridium sp.]MDU7241107.1 glucose PTS transporter subunit IIA [Clostridium sp.]